MVQKKELDSEIKSVERIERCFGWINYIAAYSIATLAVAGSITASFLAAFESTLGPHPPWLTPVFAAIPAAVYAFNKIYNFELRALYHWRKANRLRGLLCKLWYEGVDAKVLSTEYRETILRTLDEWIMFSAVETAVTAERKGLTEPPSEKKR